MKITVDEQKCDLCGICIDVCPDVFEKKGKRIVVAETPAAHDWSVCNACLANCPKGAITVQEQAKQKRI